MNSGFRKKPDRDRPGAAGFTGGSRLAGPFTQAQILHLMKTEFARARRYGFPLSCLLIQVDRVDGLIYAHGAEFRSVVRAELGKLVREKTRGADHLGLVSEDRFLLLLPHTDEDQALAVSERIRAAFAERRVEVAGQSLLLTVSVGIAAGGDPETLFFETMLSQAEMALDWAIEAHGDQSKVFRKERFMHGLESGADEEEPTEP